MPGRLAILGGGVVGVEMAQAWRTLGSQVTLIEAADRLIAREEPFAGEQVAESLREQGVDVRLGAKGHARSAARTARSTIELEDGPAVWPTSCWWRSAARPHTDDLGLESVGLEPGKTIEVDDSLRRRDGDWLYAIGDVNGRALLTHMGKYQARDRRGRDPRQGREGRPPTAQPRRG